MKEKLHSLLLFSLSFVLLGGLLSYPLLSHEAVPNDSTINYMPLMGTMNIQCKRVIIDQSEPSVTKPGVRGGATPACDQGYVPVAINNGALNSYNATTAPWLFDTNPINWGTAIEYSQATVRYSAGRDSLNSVSMICFPRKIEFRDSPCID